MKFQNKKAKNKTKNFLYNNVHAYDSHYVKKDSNNAKNSEKCRKKTCMEHFKQVPEAQCIICLHISLSP